MANSISGPCDGLMVAFGFAKEKWLKGKYSIKKLVAPMSTSIFFVICEVPYCVLEKCVVIGVRFGIINVKLGKAAPQ